jgi:hypothetical protein
MDEPEPRYAKFCQDARSWKEMLYLATGWYECQAGGLAKTLLNMGPIADSTALPQPTGCSSYLAIQVSLRLFGTF